MPPYQYQSPRNDYALSIAEMLARRGDIHAQRALQTGDAHARAAQASGQAWGNAVQSIGQAVGAIPQQIQQQKRQALADEAGQIELENARATQATRRQATEDQSILRSAQSSRMAPDQVKAQLMQLGRGDLVPVFEKTWTDLESARLGLQESRTKVANLGADYFGAMAAGIKKAGYEPMAVEWALSEAEADGHDVGQVRQMLQQRPDALRTIVDGLIEKSPTQRKLLGEEADRTLRQTQEQRAIQTAEQMAADRVADNARQDRSAAETARHNTAMEEASARSAAQRGGLTPNAEALLINRLVAQWNTASKPARDLERQTSLIDAGMQAARRGDLAQGAQTVLVAFQKILDPNSVVREAEFDRSAAGQSLMNRVHGAVERLTKGGAGIKLSELEKFYALAKEASEAQRGSYLNSVQERIGRNADRYNIPRELVFEAQPDAGTIRAKDPEGNIHEAPAGTPLPQGWVLQ